MDENTNADLIRAAGGLVWRETATGKEILILHRLRYDDWTLPKGKLEDGEAWEHTAMREVMEETGYRTRIDNFAGVTFYFVGDRPKVVAFWNMHLNQDELDRKQVLDIDQEGDIVLWLAPQEAFSHLSYPAERSLIEQVLNRANNI